jgi:hypothetical protein
MRVGCGFGFGGGEELQAGGRAMMISKTAYTTLVSVLIRYTHSSAYREVGHTYSCYTKSTSKPKHNSTSKHSPFHLPDNVHMTASTMRVEEDILPLRPP